MGKNIVNWANENRFIVALIVIIFTWITIFLLLYLKADEITKDPCSICAEKQGEEVLCIVGGIVPVSRTYFPNGSINSNEDEIRGIIREEIDKNYKTDISDFNLTLPD